MFGPLRALASFTLPNSTPTVVEVYDVAGRRIRRQELNGLDPGLHAAELSVATSGLY